MDITPAQAIIILYWQDFSRESGWQFDEEELELIEALQSAVAN